MVSITYDTSSQKRVVLKQKISDLVISSELQSGIKESDILRIRDANLYSKIGLIFRSPYFVSNRHDILRVWMLSRRRDLIFGGGDVAFYDIAAQMQANIDEIDKSSPDFSEKGFINTFNHANSQAFMTIIFSEKLADFIADVHERNRLPELITGQFTSEQLLDLNEGPVDNYVDMINNEWGQELGKFIIKKYNIDSSKIWTPKLLAQVLNELQAYYSWIFNIGFEPFKSGDAIVNKFSTKINRLNASVKGMR